MLEEMYSDNDKDDDMKLTNTVALEGSSENLREKILKEIEVISQKIGEEVQHNVLQDVYELLQATSALLTECDNKSDVKTGRIETYYLTFNVV